MTSCLINCYHIFSYFPIDKIYLEFLRINTIKTLTIIVISIMVLAINIITKYGIKKMVPNLNGEIGVL